MTTQIDAKTFIRLMNVNENFKEVLELGLKIAEQNRAQQLEYKIATELAKVIDKVEGIQDFNLEITEGRTFLIVTGKVRLMYRTFSEAFEYHPAEYELDSVNLDITVYSFDSNSKQQLLYEFNVGNIESLTFNLIA